MFNAANDELEYRPYIREKEEGKEVNESVRQLFVLLHGRPNLGVFERALRIPSA